MRGKEAVAELRRKKQEKLDEQKKLLDRKLLARYVKIITEFNISRISVVKYLFIWK